MRPAHVPTPRPDPAPFETSNLASTDLANEERENRVFRGALFAAALVHCGLLLLVLPQASVVEATPEPPKAVPLTPTPRIKPPDPPLEPPPPTPRSTRDAIPVPTAPPEPVDLPAPRIDPTLAPVIGLESTIPTGPPTDLPASAPPPSGPVAIGGDIVAPVRVHFVEPRVPTVAKRVRLGGVVRLRAVIDTEGHVVDVEVLAGLPLGLTESAVDAVQQWRYEPARLGERPIAVYLEVTVDFAIG